jgi:hypothetical protein
MKDETFSRMIWIKSVRERGKVNEIAVCNGVHGNLTVDETETKFEREEIENTLRKEKKRKNELNIP